MDWKELVNVTILNKNNFTIRKINPNFYPGASHDYYILEKKVGKERELSFAWMYTWVSSGD